MSSKSLRRSSFMRNVAGQSVLRARLRTLSGTRAINRQRHEPAPISPSLGPTVKQSSFAGVYEGTVILAFGRPESAPNVNRPRMIGHCAGDVLHETTLLLGAIAPALLWPQRHKEVLA